MRVRDQVNFIVTPEARALIEGLQEHFSNFGKRATVTEIMFRGLRLLANTENLNIKPVDNKPAKRSTT